MKAAKRSHDILKLKISERLKNRLLSLEVSTLEEVVQYFKSKSLGIDDFVKHHNQVGPKTYLELLKVLARYRLIAPKQYKLLKTKVPLARGA